MSDQIKDAESFSDQIRRVKTMSSGDPTWDLSDNDLVALQAVLLDRERLLEACKACVTALKVSTGNSTADAQRAYEAYTQTEAAIAKAEGREP